ncbi:uncharacterized protein LOC120980993 [Bufo bufo]|uniref:uncharacterized protein LOC120980993 n=1 Tax=Bufo bufo TaxID=8384 RepID=UPI001ABE9A11|nr:uncharacterized protein LOC120980993 [Bufo bufo]
MLFLPPEKRSALCLQILPYAQFHTRKLQRAFLSSWDCSPASLDRPMRLLVPVHRAFIWWMDSQRHWVNHLRGCPVRVQSVISTAVAYINNQGGTWSPAVMAETVLILSWAEKHVPALSTVHITGVDNWIADLLSRECLDPGEWALHPQVFLAICERWGQPDVDIMTSRFNNRVEDFVVRSREPMALACDVLVIPWRRFTFPYLFPLLPLIPRLLRKIRQRDCPLFSWPQIGRAGCGNTFLVSLLVD